MRNFGNISRATIPNTYRLTKRNTGSFLTSWWTKKSEVTGSFGEDRLFNVTSLLKECTFVFILMYFSFALVATTSLRVKHHLGRIVFLFPFFFSLIELYVRSSRYFFIGKYPLIGIFFNNFLHFTDCMICCLTSN